MRRMARLWALPRRDRMLLLRAVLTVLFVSALSVSGAIFIVLDMTHPLQGVIQVSSEPMRKALELLGQ